MQKSRCEWVPEGKPDYTRYHDEEWGVSVHDETRLFEMLLLEGAQAGLSWYTVLRRREGYRRAFYGFEVARVASMTDAKLEALLQEGDIVRNRLKVFAARRNAQVFLAIEAAFGSFDAYVWRFVDGESQVRRPRSMQDVPVTTPESNALSKDLKQRGMSFVGPTIMYAYMQAVGLVNDHTQRCYLCPPA